MESRKILTLPTESSVSMLLLLVLCSAKLKLLPLWAKVGRKVVGKRRGQRRGKEQDGCEQGRCFFFFETPHKNSSAVHQSYPETGAFLVKPRRLAVATDGNSIMLTGPLHEKESELEAEKRRV